MILQSLDLEKYPFEVIEKVLYMYIYNIFIKFLKNINLYSFC